jgi:RNase adapter protein RapZ
MKPAARMKRAARRRSARREPRVLVITGLSGSGKTHVARALEDVGWFCVDNLPTALIPRFAELIKSQPELHRSALVVDMRELGFLELFPESYRNLKARGLAVSLLFLEAGEKILLRRFSETRRPHPLAVNQPVIEGVREEREALSPIRKMADRILDTSDLTVHQLRDYVREQYDLRVQVDPLVLTVTSFGYKYGLPSEADLVFDVRFLPNPNFVPRLKPLTGKDRAVVRYLRRTPETEGFLRRARAFLLYMLPRYVREGKSYLTVAIGCTGGRHRSVMVANALGDELRSKGFPVKMRHRDLAQP